MPNKRLENKERKLVFRFLERQFLAEPAGKARQRSSIAKQIW